jgi:hypothetical protein
MTPDLLPLFLVCEDGDEYTERFQRFLHREFRFLRVSDGRELEKAAKERQAAGILLDLDFRRLAPARLLGEAGPVSLEPTTEERTRWSAMQGILILQHLRGRGVDLPTLLFADLDDPSQVAYLERTLAPLAIVDSREGLGQLAIRLRKLACTVGR